MDVGGRHGSVASRDAGAAHIEYGPDGNVRGGSGSGEIASVKAILCQFASQSFVIACPYALPAIFECIGGGGIGILYTSDHLNLILHGKLHVRSNLFKIKFTC